MIPKLSLASWHAAQRAAERAVRRIAWPEIVRKAAEYKRIEDEMEKEQ